MTDRYHTQEIKSKRYTEGYKTWKNYLIALVILFLLGTETIGMSQAATITYTCDNLTSTASPRLHTAPVKPSTTLTIQLETG